MRTFFSPFVLFALVGCTTTEPAPRSQAGSDAARIERTSTVAADTSALGAMLPRPKQAFTLRATPDKAPTLHDVVVELEKSTGVHFVVSDEARQVLRSSSSGLLSDMNVPPREAWRVVETMLAQSDVVLVPSRGTEPVTITLTSKLERGGQGLKGYAVPIDVSALDECVDHPAVIFSTVIDIHPLDARQMSTSIRQLFPDQQTQSILPLDGSQMMLTALGPQLVTAVRMMQNAATSRSEKMDEVSKTTVPAGGASPR